MARRGLQRDLRRPAGDVDQHAHHHLALLAGPARARRIDRVGRHEVAELRGRHRLGRRRRGRRRLLRLGVDRRLRRRRPLLHRLGRRRLGLLGGWGGGGGGGASTGKSGGGRSGGGGSIIVASSGGGGVILGRRRRLVERRTRAAPAARPAPCGLPSARCRRPSSLAGSTWVSAQPPPTWKKITSASSAALAPSATAARL